MLAKVQIRPIPFSAAPAPCAAFSNPASFSFLLDLLFSQYPLNLMTSLSQSLSVFQSLLLPSSLSTSLPSPCSHALPSWLGPVLSLQHLPLFLSVLFHCILISSLFWAFFLIHI